MLKLSIFFCLLYFALYDNLSIFDQDGESLVVDAIQDQMNSGFDPLDLAFEPKKPWPDFKDFGKKRPLYGVTYFPWRTSENCSSISESDIEEDMKLISKIAGSIYVYELFCDFAPFLVNVTRRYSMTILLGLQLNDDEEFRRQERILHDMLLDPSLNMSHVVAIAIGHLELAPSLNGPNATTMIQEITRKLRNVTVTGDSSNFPDIPISTCDTIGSLFRRNLNRFEEVYIDSNNPMESEHDPSAAAGSLYQEIRNIRGQAKQNDDRGIVKPILLADIGWASGGYYDFRIIDHQDKTFNKLSPSTPRNRTLIQPKEQLRFLFRLRCNPRVPPMYYVHSAFDLTWKYPSNDSAAYWGLADAQTRKLKPGILKALKFISCQEDEPDFDEGRIFDGMKSWTPLLIAVCVVLTIMFFVMLTLVFWFWRRKREAVQKLQLTQMEVLRHQSTASTEESERYVRDFSAVNARWDDYLNMLEPECEDLSDLVDPTLRIDMSDLELKEIIGEGHFGIVQKGKYHVNGNAVDVAVKRLHVGAKNVHQFLQEGIKMQKFNHAHVLNLVGISFTPTNMPMIITPYLPEGDVLQFVRKIENKNVPLRDLVNFCVQIAEGMRYLHELKMIHRDLAARNCMLDKNLVVKIADFGLCRDISDNDSYQTTKSFELPIRWMPPEAIEKLKWTSKSDIWSYGVVLWEVLTRGKQPYPDVALIELRAYLKNGGRLEKPEECPNVMYQVMRACWSLHPNIRPKFNDLFNILSSLFQGLEQGRDIDNDEYYNFITPLLAQRRLTIESDISSPPQSPTSEEDICYIVNIEMPNQIERGSTATSSAPRHFRDKAKRLLGIKRQKSLA